MNFSLTYSHHVRLGSLKIIRDLSDGLKQKDRNYKKVVKLKFYA